jgi:hypothetical protein
MAGSGFYLSGRKYFPRLDGFLGDGSGAYIYQKMAMV